METDDHADPCDSEPIAGDPDNRGDTPSERARGKIGDASGTVKPPVGDVQRAIPQSQDDA